MVDRGEELYQMAVQLQLEGIVTKKLGSPYRGDRTADWLKIKRPGAIPPSRFGR
jgi:bifunctional non-homologous end joining protein LigD